MTVDEFIPKFVQWMTAQGRPLVNHNSDRTGGWFRISEGRQRLFHYAVELEKALNEVPSGASETISIPHVVLKGGVNTFANGNWRWMTHEHPDGPQPCIEDFACATMRDEWPGYVVERDASGCITREGPAPFKTASEQRRYEELSGLVAAHGSDRMVQSKEHPLAQDEAVKKFPRLNEMFPEFANWGKGGSSMVDNVDQVLGAPVQYGEE